MDEGDTDEDGAVSGMHKGSYRNAKGKKVQMQSQQLKKRKQTAASHGAAFTTELCF